MKGVPSSRPGRTSGRRSVGDLPGELELVVEALDRLPVRGDLGLDELERDLLVELLVDDLVDPAHAAVAQLLDDLVAAGEEWSPW